MYQDLGQDADPEKQELKYRVGISEYLTGYGISIKNPQKIHSTTFTAKQSCSFFEYFSNMDNKQLLALNDLREKRALKKVEISKLSHEMQAILHKCPIERFHSANELKKNEIKYLTGEWFEEYVYHLLRKHFSLDNKAIAIGVQIEQGENVNNEIDIMLTLNNRMYVVECKTSIIDSDNDRNILNETLYKLSALKKDFGLYAKPYLFTLSREKDEIKDTHKKRSALFGIKMVAGEILREPGEIGKLLESM